VWARALVIYKPSVDRAGRGWRRRAFSTGGHTASWPPLARLDPPPPRISSLCVCARDMVVSRCRGIGPPSSGIVLGTLFLLAADLRRHRLWIGHGRGWRSAELVVRVRTREKVCRSDSRFRRKLSGTTDIVLWECRPQMMCVAKRVWFCLYTEFVVCVGLSS